MQGQGFPNFQDAEASILEKGMMAMRHGIDYLLKHYKEMGTIARRPESERSWLITADIRLTVEQRKQVDDETIAYQLQELLNSVEYPLLLSTILPNIARGDG